MLLFWSNTDAATPLSSAEAESDAKVEASQELLDIGTWWKDVGESHRECGERRHRSNLNNTENGLGQNETCEHDLTVDSA